MVSKILTELESALGLEAIHKQRDVSFFMYFDQIFLLIFLFIWTLFKLIFISIFVWPFPEYNNFLMDDPYTGQNIFMDSPLENLARL